MKMKISIFILILGIALLTVGIKTVATNQEIVKEIEIGRQQISEEKVELEKIRHEVEQMEEDVLLSIAELDLIHSIAEEYDLPPELALAMMKVESNFNPNAKNKACHGLLQVSSLYHTSNLFDLKRNITASAGLMSELIDESDTLQQALGKYNYGVTGYEKYVSREGRFATNYSEKVLYYYNGLLK